ncbi:DeoR/GlpR family DNA-binding transcription regulator [Kozakia baliensis]|uniref:DeoR family transcriptional regulator n=1 Tax=Kozakia baliensis TaxID=153496 RepID=A0A1D8UU83_9PROT|nr:DeoR/GlpR family DNA-binding transcription regulator [Kozakia baliensis]AOX17191.1 DeoR family transcriptional regulator [Kozakia baliensis]GBR32355.1 transcriptional regulator [Kozakia baliensis NRIC 0488]GEL64514.1 DeoR family transcriptional regulator [Kozakia baliensis]
MTDVTMPESKAVSARRRELLDYVIEHGGAQIDELVERFSTSRMTVHRDLHALAEQGFVRKIHGGVTTLSNGIVESSVLHRSRRASHEKKAIAAMAAQLIEPGQIIALDDSTTARFLASNLLHIGSLTVMTNSLGIATTLAGVRDINLVSLGGRYNPTFDAFFGILCEQSIQALRANTLFMSVSAIHGLTTYHQEQDIVKAKHALMKIVDRRVLMVNSTKFGMSALNRLADLSEFDLVITDSKIDPVIKSKILDAGINLKIAALSPESVVERTEEAA